MKNTKLEVAKGRVGSLARTTPIHSHCKRRDTKKRPTPERAYHQVLYVPVFSVVPASDSGFADIPYRSSNIFIRSG